MYSQRFRDIAALFNDDEAAVETEDGDAAPYTTASASAMDVMNYAGKELSSIVSSVSSATANHFQQLRQNQTQYNEDNEDNEDNSNSDDDLSTEAEPGRYNYSQSPPQRQSFAKAMLRQQHLHNKQQPKELVLNTTDSTCTDSCTVSSRTTMSYDDNNSDSTSPTRMNIGNLSYELPSPDRSWVVSTVQQQQQQPQQVIVETNTNLASPWLETTATHKVTNMIPHHQVVVTPQSTFSPLPSSQSPQQQQQQPSSSSSSWRARQFKRTFRHRASIRQRRASNSSSSSNVCNSSSNSNSNSNTTATILPPQQQQPQSQPQPRPQPQPQPYNDSNIMMVSLVDTTDSSSVAASVSVSSSSSSSQQPSPVQNLRRIFEKNDNTSENNDESDRNRSSPYSSSSSSPRSSPDPVILPVVRRRRAAAVVIPVVLPGVLSKSEESENKEEEADEDEQQQQQQHHVIAYPSHQKQQQPSVTQSQAVVTAAAAAPWWIDMEDRVDRYHRSVVATQELLSSSTSSSSSSSSVEVDLRQSYEEFAETQNQLGKVMAVSLYKGMAISKEKYQRELQELKEHHERELTELRRLNSTTITTTTNNNSRANSVATTSQHHQNHRNKAFRQRWKNRMNDTNNDNDDDFIGVNGEGDSSPIEYASTVLSNMSCRELSMDRYRSRLLKQMKKNTPTTAATTTTIASSTPTPTKILPTRSSSTVVPVTVDSVVNDVVEEEETTVPVSTTDPTTVVEADDDNDEDDNSSNNNTPKDADAIEIQRLLDELQIAERRQQLLEKQLQQAGVVLAEDIPYQLAKDKVTSISKRMNDIGSSNITHDDPLIEKQLRQEYFQLEKEMSKYITALSLTDEYANERIQQEQQWEQKNIKKNQLALEAIRSYMPVNIRKMTNDELSAPQEDCRREGLSKDMIKKFRRTNVLQLLRVDPITISKWHPSTIEAYRVTGLTITERRALHHHLLKVGNIWNTKNQTISGGGGDPMNNRKLTWYQTMKMNFKEALDRYERHVATTATSGGGDTSTDNHQCNMIGKQCPVRANLSIEYYYSQGGGAIGLGYPINDIYETPMTVAGGSSNDQNKLQQKSPAETIAEARRERRRSSSNGESSDNHYYSTTTTMTRTIIPTKIKSRMSVVVPTTTLPTTSSTRQNKMPISMLMKQISNSSSSSNNKPNGGLLAAIATRRID